MSTDSKKILFLTLFRYQVKIAKEYENALKPHHSDLLKIKEYLNINPYSLLFLKYPHGLKPNNDEAQKILSYYRSVRKTYKSFGRRILTSNFFLKIQMRQSIIKTHKLIKKNKYDAICVWNGYALPLAAAIFVARKMAVKTIFFEHGALPYTTTLDSMGINYESSLSLLTKETIERFSPSEDYRPIQTLQVRNKRQHKQAFKDTDEGSIESLPSNYLFVPFQVHNDTQILINSPSIHNMHDLVKHIVNANNAGSLKSKKKYNIVVKEHPSDYSQISYKFLREKYKNDVLFANNFPTELLIKKSQGVITINSSVGIESLIFNKPVITLGNAFYNVSGLVLHVSNPESLGEYFDYFNSPVDKKLIQKYLQLLATKYYVPGHWNDLNKVHLHSVTTKILSIIENKNEFLSLLNNQAPLKNTTPSLS